MTGILYGCIFNAKEQNRKIIQEAEKKHLKGVISWKASMTQVWTSQHDSISSPSNHDGGNNFYWGNEVAARASEFHKQYMSKRGALSYMHFEKLSHSSFEPAVTSVFLFQFFFFFQLTKETWKIFKMPFTHFQLSFSNKRKIFHLIVSI